MSVTYYPGRSGVQEMMTDEAQHRRQIASVVNQLMKGQGNSVLQLTLDPGATTTTIVDVRISLQTAPLATPLTASAAAEMAAGTLWFEPSKGQCVVHHANSSVADRIYNLSLTG